MADPKKQTLDESVEEAPFNMALMFYISLSKLMEARDKASIIGDIGSWFKCSHRIYLRVRFKFNDDEKKIYDDMIIKAKNIFKSNTRLNGSVASQVNNLVINNVSEVLDQFDSELMETMHRYKMIFPKIEASGLKKLMERYGIGAMG